MVEELVRLWRLTGTGLTATNRVGHAPQVAVTEETFSFDGTGVPVQPYSIELRAFPMR